MKTTSPIVMPRRIRVASIWASARQAMPHCRQVRLDKESRVGTPHLAEFDASIKATPVAKFNSGGDPRYETRRNCTGAHLLASYHHP